MEQKIYSVTEINAFLKEYIEAPEFLNNLYITGEISNLTFNKSGHIYFSIKDEGATIKAVVWKSNADNMKRWNPENGMKITVKGRFSFYIVGGTITFEVRDVQLEGKGELQKLYDERYAWLEINGWFDQSIKKPIPIFPTNIGIITAASGAAIHDLITTIQRRYPIANIYLFPAQVQGEQARFDIAKKIDAANNFSIPLDTLIIGRGGGSYEDLWAFNEIEVLKAIRNSLIPTVSAVGHQPDYTLSDYVADLRAPTPTSAGEMTTPNIAELKRNLQNYYVDYQAIINSKIQESELFLNRIIGRNSLITKNIVNQKEIELKNIYQINNRHMQQILMHKTQELMNLNQQQIILDPLIPLQRGFALVTEMSGKIISTNSNIKIGDQLGIKTKDSHIEAVVTKIKKEHK
ncbi:exodeoxyribonuclease VII large subunit [Williamsoniiplasma luminosum]|uniref:Exodeoxyribonuclease 7 large subunit n=1 Tax=Williamsoniiplasma luminosum TaxID=214888 RepID=A0A2K8NU52_9MOLU|nr:exodeoxyribonuclease VII large subunit [Williamsoniiplasma luminosum]ATZ17329.1 exodeoxyribonuclease VII large subunit [Williamsoniiplasma luminosum]